jgi:hypothetical protein
MKSKKNSRVAGSALPRPISKSFLFAGTMSDLGSDITYCNKPHSFSRSSSDSLSSWSSSSLAVDRRSIASLNLSKEKAPGITRKREGGNTAADSSKVFPLPESWRMTPVESIGDVILGRQRSPENHRSRETIEKGRIHGTPSVHAMPREIHNRGKQTITRDC